MHAFTIYTTFFRPILHKNTYFFTPMNILNKIDPPIDYHGQELSKKLFYLIIYLGYAISLVIGIVLSDLKYTLYAGILTVILSFIIVVPSWSMYRKNPLKFTKEKEE
ncbi:Signal peptidase complex subunit 1 [Nosema granulosis]|uniref:Signal peptidase complex subunit 1 n=1 Tax=Nosema granulosis TaxID=83296 RepID=A0A9P6GXQ5_9MICR|nr:Signal peptidase complex subunit 1 [Nosema granulosis]